MRREPRPFHEMTMRTVRRLHVICWLVVAAASAPLLAQAPGTGGRTPADAPVATAAAQVTAPVAAYPWRGQEDAIEAYMRTATIVRFTDIPVGVTKPQRAYLAPGGPVGSMAWKPLPTGMLHGKMESYRSEIAAYRLSRHLGLHMVPPAVERRVKGVRGAAIYWVDGTRPWNPAEPPRAPGARWSRQTSRMLMFDQLIANIDRNQGNLLYDDEGHLYLIDHSRAFTTQPTLGTLKPPQQFDKALWTKMAALTREELTGVLSPWVNSGQITALLKRRDEMQRHITRLVEERGDAVTFLPPEPVASTAHR